MCRERDTVGGVNRIGGCGVSGQCIIFAAAAAAAAAAAVNLLQLLLLYETMRKRRIQ